MTSLYILNILLVIALSVTAEDKYGWEHWKVTTHNSTHVAQLKYLEINNKLMFWEAPHHGNTLDNGEVLIANEVADNLRNMLVNNGAIVTVFSSDIMQSINGVHERLAARREIRPGEFAYDRDDFNTYEDIMGELSRLVGQCSPPVECTTTNAGFSYEGRELIIFKMSTGEGHQAVWLDSLIHAREWLAGATNMRLLEHMVLGYGSDPDVTSLLDTYDWYFLPVMNPDGYAHSWTPNDIFARFWRKSRNPNTGSSCVGVDLNRNYAYEWGGAGTSTDPCSDQFLGPEPASEPETQAVQAMADMLGDTTLLWLSYHTPVYMYLIPWAHNDRNTGQCVYADDHDQLYAVMEKGIAAIESTHNTEWEFGNTCEILYAASGSTMDYVKNAGVKYVYTPELRGPGFDPDQDAISLSFEESWNGLVAIVQAIEDQK